MGDGDRRDPRPTGAGGEIVVIGDVMVDVVARHRLPIAAASDTPAQIHLSGGGSAANTAAWLAAHGERPRLFAAVGDDDLGRRAVRELEGGGVHFAGPMVHGAVTGTCVVLVGPDHERTMLPDRGANDRLPLAMVRQALGTDPGWVHLSGYTLLDAGSRPAGRAAIAAAVALGCPLSVDAASAAPLAAVGAATFLDWIAGASVVFGNDEEIDALGGVEAVLAQVAAVVVKHGSAGATWTDGIERHTVDGVRVDAVDTTGAGDAFAAGWIASYRRHGEVVAALAGAADAGARAVVLEGARPTGSVPGT